MAAKGRQEHKEGNPEKNMQDIMKLWDVVRETTYAIPICHGHGHVEQVYENTLANRLRKLGISIEQQKPLAVYGEDDTVIGEYFADRFVDGRLIVELKACRALAEERIAQVLGCQRSAQVERGSLIDFGSARFQIKKYAVSDPRKTRIAARLGSILFSFASFAFFRG